MSEKAVVFACCGRLGAAAPLAWQEAAKVYDNQAPRLPAIFPSGQLSPPNFNCRLAGTLLSTAVTGYVWPIRFGGGCKKLC